jgi:hypothetical protein
MCVVFGGGIYIFGLLALFCFVCLLAFFLSDHVNFAGIHSELGPVIISMVEESREKDQLVILKAIYRTQFRYV